MNPFAKLITVQLSENVDVRPGDLISVEIVVGRPPDAAHSSTSVKLNEREVPVATGFDFERGRASALDQMHARKTRPVERPRLALLEQAARSIGERIGDGLEAFRAEHGGLPPIGFTLLLFDFGEDGWMTYISNAARADMLQAMREFLAKHEAAG